MSGRFSLLALACSVVLIACARQAPPPGGAEDRIPPLVTGIWPAPNTTEVPVDLTMIAEFTEWMNERISPGVVIFSPPLKKIPQVEMRANRLTIKPRLPLDSQTTYTMTLQNILSDLRGNLLPSPFQITFSTGEKIDTLELSGTVTHPQGKVPNRTVVGLWPIEPEMREKFSWMRQLPTTQPADSTSALEISDSIDLIKEPPLYRVATDSTGYFRLSGLAAGTFRLAAFVDENGNSRIDPSSEWSALSESDIQLREGETSPFVTLRLALNDTGLVRLIGAEQLPRQQLQLQFNRPLKRETAFQLSSYSIAAADSSDTSAVPQIKAVYPGVQDQHPVLWIEGAKPKKIYSIQVQNLTDSSGISLDTAFRKTSITWQSLVTDTLPISIAKASPPHGTVEASPNDTLKLYFSSPAMDQEWISRLRLISTAETLALVGEWAYPNQLHLRPTQQLQPAVTYSLQRETLDTLQSGLSAPIDSLIRSSWRTISTFSVWDEMKLGSAQICLPPIEKLCVEVRHLGTAQPKSYYGQPDSNGCLTLSPLPEGKYSVGGYVDQNENQRFDSGTLSPWRAAEPFFSWSDTLFVKRGETTLYDRRPEKVE